MHRIRRLAVRLLNLFRRGRLDDDLRDQLDAHAALIEDDLARCGMEPTAARAAARRAIGNRTLVRQLAREHHAFASLDTLASDVRLAARRLARQRGAAIVSILALGSGVAATAVTWSLVSAILLNPLPVRESDRLVMVGTAFDVNPYPVYSAIRETDVFEAAAGGGRRDITLGPQPAQPAVGYFASHDFFNVLGVLPALGRDFLPEDDRRGAPLVAMLSDGYWRRAFGGRTDVAGAEVIVSGQPAVVIGVVPRQFRGLDLTDPPDIYVPLHAVETVEGRSDGTSLLDAGDREARGWLTIVGRLRPGSHFTDAGIRLNQLLSSIAARDGPIGVRMLNAAAVPRAVLGDTGSSFSFVFLLAVGLLLAIGCVASGVLLLVRTEARREELATCLALGASKGRLLRGVVVEGGLLAAAGTALGLPASAWLFGALRAFELPGGLQLDLLDLSLDASAVAVAGGTAAAATLVVAAIAGSFVFSPQLMAVHRQQPGTTPRVTRSYARLALGGGQVAISLVLLAGAGLLARSLVGALAAGPDDDIRRIVTGRIDPRSWGHTEETVATFLDELRRRLVSQPGIEAVTFALPYTNMLGGSIPVDGEPRTFPSLVYYQGVDDEFFTTFGLRLLAGRPFSGTERADGPSVVILSESLARLIAADGDVVGHDIGLFWRTEDLAADVIGVVPDVITSANRWSPYVIYGPVTQMPGRTDRTFFLRPSRDPGATIREATRAIQALDPALAPPAMQTIGERLDAQMRAQRFTMLVVGSVGVAAAVLTSLGVYVLAESLVRRRRRELGIRAALGASGLHIAMAVVGEAGLLAGAGVLAGVAAIWTASLELLRGLFPLFRIEPFDPPSLAAASVLIVGLVLAVSLRPARAATRMDLARVLAEE